MDKQKIIAIVLVILFGGCMVYEMMDNCTIDNYTIYSIKTIGQEKHKLTVYVKDGFTGNAANLSPIEIIQKIGPVEDLHSAEKEITYKITNKNGIAVFHLPPGIYYYRGKGSHLGYTDSIDLDSDKEIRIEIVVQPQGQ